MNAGGNFESQGVERDEAGGVALVIGFGRVGFHRGDVRVVKAQRRFAAGGDDVAFVKFEPHGAGDVFLALGDEGLQRLALGREPKAVINERGVFWDERIAQVHDFAIHRERLHLSVRLHEDRAAGCLVDATRLHADETILDEIDAPDAVASTEFVEHFHHPEWREPRVIFGIIFPGFLVSCFIQKRGEFVIADRDADAFFKNQLDGFSFIRRFLGRDAEHIHVACFFRAGVKPRVFEDAALEADV